MDALRRTTLTHAPVKLPDTAPWSVEPLPDRDGATPRPVSSVALRAAALVLVALGIVPLANLIRPGAIPWWDLAAREWLVRGTLLAVTSFALARVASDGLSRVLNALHAAVLRPAGGWFTAGVALCAASAAAVVARYCFAGRPFTSDEMAQLWQARILLSGHLALPAEPLAAFFNTAPAYDLGQRWFTQYPAGASVPAAVGLAFGAAWLVNPLLLGGAVGCWYDFTRHAFDESAARWSSLLLVTSPFVLLMSGTQMSHVPALAFVCAALAALARWDRAEAAAAWRPALALGAAVGALATIRPYDGVLLAATVGAFQLASLRQRPDLLASLWAQVAVGGGLVALSLGANAATTGAPFTFAYDLLNGPAHGVGFHVDPNGDLHTPLRGLRMTSGYFMRLDRFLFEWPVPSLLPAITTLALLRRPTRWDVLLLALFGAFAAGYWAYWFDGFFDGPRFLFPVVPVVVLYTARVPAALGERLRSDVAGRAAVLFLALCIAVSWTLPGVSSAGLRLRSHAAQRGKLKTDIAGQVRRARLSNALVIVHESWRGTLLARLRVLGMTAFAAERAVNTLDACALQEALDRSDADPPAPTERAARLSRVVAYAHDAGAVRPAGGSDAAERVSLNPERRPSQACLDAVAADTRYGAMPFARFLAEQHVDSDGRVGGAVVFVRDLGAANARLRARFPERTWYRYQQPAGQADERNPFVPY